MKKTRFSVLLALLLGILTITLWWSCQTPTDIVEIQPPVAPTGLIATAASQTQINLSWTASTGATSYAVYRRFVTGEYSRIAHSVTKTNYSDTTLSCSDPLALDTFYEYYVIAYNAGGSSSASNTAHAMTNQCTLTAPAATTALTATAVSQTQINLSWNAVSGATGHYIYRNSVYIGSTPTTSYSDAGLVLNTTYSYYVISYNAGGNSPASNTASATTFPNPPAAPTGLTATGVLKTEIDLSWTASTGATSYTLSRIGYGVIYTGSLTSYSNTGLIVNTSYSYTVTASNAGGTSGVSNTATATTLPDAPAAPTLSATAASQTQINLSWNAVSGATSYTISRIGYGFIYTGSATSFSDTGLTVNTSYSYTMYASNAGGNSVWSNTASATTDAATPGTPVISAMNTGSQTSNSISWTNSSPFTETSFDVERSLDGTSGWVLAFNRGVGFIAAPDTPLNPGTTYYYRMRARLDTGGRTYFSGYSSVVSATTLR